MGNVYDPERQISYSRGNLSFTSINLPRWAILADHDEKKFYESLDAMMELVGKPDCWTGSRFRPPACLQLPLPDGPGRWLDSDQLVPPTRCVRC